MCKALEEKYFYDKYVKFCLLFDDEINELNRKMVEIPKPSYILDNMASNEELCKIAEKYSDEQLDSFLEVLMFNYNEVLYHVETEHFGIMGNELLTKNLRKIDKL